MSDPISSVARYRVVAGREDEFLEIIDRHWTTLRELEYAFFAAEGFPKLLASHGVSLE